MGKKPKEEISNAASMLGKKSAKTRMEKWGREEFQRRMREWGKLGGRPRKRDNDTKKGGGK